MKNPPKNFRWVSEKNHIFELQNKKNMTHLTLEERYEIFSLKKQGFTNSKIATILSRAKSTIGRELKRNADKRNQSYRPALAQKKCFKRHQSKKKRIVFTTQIQEQVISLLKEGYSPEQIKGYSFKNKSACVSAECIYQFIWKDKGKGGSLYKYLRTKGKKYQKRGNKQAGRGCIPNRRDIDQRPKLVEDKSRFGDLEMDLIIGKGHKGVLLTINDRATGMLKMKYLKSKEAKQIERMAIDLLEDWSPLLHTITTDNGKEFANHQEIAEQLNIDFFFAKPYHSWERGANENLNGLVRQYFPKGSNFDNIDNEKVEKVTQILNNRPRKRYGFRSPNQVFAMAIKNEGKVAFIN